mgnify:CR=1 FL=1
MAKKSFLAGVDKETRDKIYKLRRDSKEKAKKEADKQSERYQGKLLELQKRFNDAIEEAKEDDLIPKNTTIAKIGQLPSKPPKRWATTYNRIFGRKKAKAKAKSAVSRVVDTVSKAVSKPAPKKTASKKKTPAKKK